MIFLMAMRFAKKLPRKICNIAKNENVDFMTITKVNEQTIIKKKLSGKMILHI